MSDDLSRYLIAGAETLSIPINHQAARQFLQYLDVLQEWSERINLTAIQDSREIVVKHFIDSIAPLGFGLIEPEFTLLDVGTGAGFPGIPLKIMTPRLSVTLLEPNKKKLSFLLYVTGLLRLTNMSVLGMTLQQFSTQTDQRFDLAATRAVNLKSLFAPVQQVLRPTGTLLAYRSSPLEESDVPDGLAIQTEWTYNLPYDFGARVLSQLHLNPAGSGAKRGH